MFWKWEKRACEQLAKAEALKDINTELNQQLNSLVHLVSTSSILKEILDSKLELEKKGKKAKELYISPVNYYELLDSMPQAISTYQKSIKTILGLKVYLSQEHKLKVE